ncbi:MAG: tRNA pseudouridine(54/55) synthase Pus10 [Candidatus Anstonellales archaeon]
MEEKNITNSIKNIDLSSNNFNSENCELCKGKWNSYVNLLKSAFLAIEKLNNNLQKKITIGIATTIHIDLAINENFFLDKINISTKTLINLIIKEKIKQFDKFIMSIQPQNAQLMLTIDFVSNNYVISNNPVFILAKYNKYSRNICQNIWFCEKCYRKGCENCNYTGVKYESIAAICERGIKKIMKIKKFFLHANGREDVDVRTLGNGRYCVLEFKPTKFYETIDLTSLENAINEEGSKFGIKLKLIKIVNRSFLNVVTESEFDKHYKAIVKTERTINENDLINLNNRLIYTTISQRTPLRVAKRRADLIRKKTIKEVNCELIDEHTFIMKVKCQSGTYVKELIHGDKGRTKPSVSEILNTKAECVELDIEKFEDHFIELFIKN